MKFFTKSFYTGRLTEKEFANKIIQYQENLHSIDPFITDEIKKFIKEVNVHDALTKKICINRNPGDLRLELRCGDLQVGYYDVHVSFKEVKISDVVINRWREILNDKDVEILADEINLTEKGKFSYGLIFSSYKDICFEFENLKFIKNGCKGRKFKDYVDRITIQ
jgi:hypothetical protein